MLKNLPLYIGLRYTRSARNEGYLSFVSALSIGAMALGVMALITVLSVMNGFDREIKSRLLQVMPHLVALPDEPLGQTEYRELADIIGASAAVETIIPLAQSYVMVSYEEQKLGGMLRGIEPGDAMYAELRSGMLAGDLQALKSGEYGIVLGSQVARKLGLFVGDRLQLTLPQLSVTPLGIFPRIKSAAVVGVFQVGAEVDGSAVFMYRGDVQNLLRLGDRYQGLQIQLRDPYAVAIQMPKFVDLLPPTTAWFSWQESMSTLFTAMRMEKQIVRLLLSVIIAVAAFNIIASLVLMVSNKRADIAVIRTLGASPATVMKIFMVQGVAVGFLGIAIGTLFGCLLAANIGDLLSLAEGLLGVHLFDPSVYLISVLPSRILLSDVLSVALTSLFLCFFAALYPAWRASQVMPAEALRYDI